MPKTLLLADDSVTIQKVVGISFANEDIEITTVDNGRDAVAKARAIRPDVILADVVMPGMSGYEVCEVVKADPNLRHIPVLLLTGTFEAFDQARAAAVGAAGHVAKPFEAQTLVDRVKQLLAAAPPASAPQRQPAAAPAPSPAPASEDAFDFFSDAPEQAAAVPPPIPSAESFDLDGADGAFAFGDDDLASDLAEPPAAKRPAAAAAVPRDATVAMFVDPPVAANDDAFDFSFGGDDGADAQSEPLDPDQLAHTTLLDPAAGSGLDISSSDLAFDAAPAAATQILSFGDDGPQSLPLAAEDAELDLAETDPLDEAPLAGEPLDEADPFETTMPPIGGLRTGAPDRFERDPFEDAPMMAGDPLPAEGDLDAASPFGEEPESGEPIAGEELAGTGWDDASPFESPPPVAPARGSEPATAPAIARADLHDMIEKIAWDAFAPITEKIVRETIAKIEQVAWEVVPKLAETLIQEEIRRLKGDS
jgi:CheY-like chemotaxis protein